MNPKNKKPPQTHGPHPRHAAPPARLSVMQPKMAAAIERSKQITPSASPSHRPQPATAMPTRQPSSRPPANPARPAPPRPFAPNNAAPQKASSMQPKRTPAAPPPARPPQRQPVVAVTKTAPAPPSANRPSSSVQRKASAPAGFAGVRAPANARGAVPRGGVIQRLRLTQAGRDIAEDNDTLKAEYNLAKTQGRWVDWQTIMDAQNAKPRVEIPAIMSMGPPSVVAEPVVEVPVVVEAPKIVVKAPKKAPVPLPAGVLLKTKLPKKGGTPGQRYIDHSKDGSTHTSITFKNRDADTVTITGMHVTFSDGSHIFWNHQSPTGTFHLSSQGGAKIASIAKTSSLEKAWTWIRKDAAKVNCTAVEPTWT